MYLRENRRWVPLRFASKFLLQPAILVQFVILASPAIFSILQAVSLYYLLKLLPKKMLVLSQLTSITLLPKYLILF